MDESIYKKIGESILTQSLKKGCTYADFRFEIVKDENISLRDASVEAVKYNETIGFGIKVIYKKTWGFAASNVITLESAVETLDKAIQMAKALSKINRFPVELTPEKSVHDKYESEFKINPFEISLEKKIDYMMKVNKKLLSSKIVNYANFDVSFVDEFKYFISTEDIEVTQHRIRSNANYMITSIDKKKGKYETLRSNSYPVGMGYEIFEFFDFLNEADKTPKLLEEKLNAESIVPGKYDLVIDPTNLFLTIHESIGHATELDRVLGYEADYAGTSFATLDKLNTLHYGSKVVNIKADRTQKYGLSTIAYDDEGVKTKDWYLIKDGLLVDYQYNRETAARYDFESSKACSFADSWSSFPIQRMPNISLEPSKKDITTKDLISKVENGIYIVGDNSWSIDMQRYNFQFTGQLFYKIKNGRIDGMYKDVAYQSRTTDFWGSCEEVGGMSTYILPGAFNCGKGQPGQVAAVSHGCPSALFRNINVLNTQNENK